MKNIAVIFAGGTGQRMKTEIPKQFLKVHGKEIIIHTLEKFNDNNVIDEIYVACIESWIQHLNKLIKKFNINKVKSVFAGGATGQDSIFIALSEVKKDHEDAIVLIHDGVRPLITEKTIIKCIKSVKEFGSAITVTPCFETPIKSLSGETVESMPSRNEMYTAQAPQGFYLNELLEAHLKEREKNPSYEGIVDSCGLMFANGKKCHLVLGNPGNIKVTTQEDYCTLIGNYSVNDYREFLETNKK